MADDPATENAKKRLAEEQQVSDKIRADFLERMKGKPTPTQQENDLAALGAHFTEHEEDGSGPDPYAAKQVEASKPAASYQTRQATAAPRPRSE
jgi:hypothetical protein